MRRVAAVAFAIGLVLCGGRALAAPGAGGTIEYVVQPGDSCWSIAEQVFGDGKRYDRIHRLNDLGPQPHILVPGTILRLPGTESPPEARVGTPRNDVRARSPKALDWQQARDEMALWRLFRVATGSESSAEIRFRDQSSLLMRDNALLVIHGASSAAARMNRSARTVVDLEKGTLRGGLERLDAEAGLSIRTPSSRVDLAATEAQVEVDEDLSSLVSIWEGRASVSAQGRTVDVPADSGTTVRKGEAPAPPRRLPGRPAWADAARDRIVTVPRGFPGAFEASWKPVPGAARYRVELARDARFRQLVVDAVVGSGLLAFRAEDLAPGTYFARVSAIDGGRLQGSASAPLAVRVVSVATSRRLDPIAASDGVPAWETAGFVRIDPPDNSPAGTEVRVDDGAWSPASASLRLVLPGLHRVRYRSADGVAPAGFDVRVLAVAADVSVPGSAVRVPPCDVDVEVAVHDERGRPLGLPGLSAVAGGASLPLQDAGAGLYRGRHFLAADAAPGTREVAVAWAGGPLGRASFVVASPAQPAPAPGPASSFAWPDAPPAPEWTRAVSGLPGLGVRPVTRLGVGAGVAEAGAPGNALFVRSDLRGELALAGGRLGVDLDVPWLDVEASGTWADTARVGDVRVGVRGIAWEGRGVAIGPAFRLVLPTARRGRVVDDVGIEPGVRVEWAPAPRWLLGTSQVLGLDTDFSGLAALAWTATLSAGWRPVPRLGLALELASVIGVHDDAARALAASGGVWVYLGRARIGVAAGGGLNADGRDEAGRFAATIQADVGFGGP